MNDLAQLQADLARYLLGNPETAAVPFTEFRKMVVESAADEAAAAWKIRVDGSVGVAALVLPPSVRTKYSNVPGPQYSVEIMVRIFEDPKVNNTGLTSEDVGLSVLRWVDGLVIEDLTELYGDTDQEALRPNSDYEGFLVHDVVFVGELPQDMLARTTAPGITEADGVVTLTCIDAGAEIYYTVTAAGDDLTGPEIGNAEQLYSAPFTVAVGDVVRVQALATGKLPSHLARANIV
jgi:hypothetical protein